MKISNISLFPFSVLAWMGLIGSLIIHICALLGVLSMGFFAWFMMMGAILLFGLSVVVSNTIEKNSTDENSLRKLCRPCPPWMGLMVVFFFLYCFLNFFLILFHFWKGFGGAGGATFLFLRYFSTFWLLFYSAAAIRLYSARRITIGHLTACYSKMKESMKE